MWGPNKADCPGESWFALLSRCNYIICNSSSFCSWKWPSLNDKCYLKTGSRCCYFIRHCTKASVRHTSPPLYPQGNRLPLGSWHTLLAVIAPVQFSSATTPVLQGRHPPSLKYLFASLFLHSLFVSHFLCISKLHESLIFSFWFLDSLYVLLSSVFS